MPKKIRRRAAVFHKKKVTFSKVLIGILVVVGCAGVLAGGYFTAKFSVEGWPFGGSAVSGGSAAPESLDSNPESQTPSSDPASVPPEPTPQTGGLRAFYAPLSLLRDQAALDIHHKSEMMKTIACLREKYKLKMKVERFIREK